MGTIRTTIAWVLGLLGFFVSSAAGEYVLVDDYSGEALFSNFTFFTETDPTEGFVKYLGEADARDARLIDVTTGSDGESVVYMGADYTNIAPDGRASVRISSKKAYNQGLFIADFAHVPGSACGTWPAFWMFGPDWPNGGEIDIYEGVNLGSFNGMALHTGPNCSIAPHFGYRGRMESKNCDVAAPEQESNQGCQIMSNNPMSFGSSANMADGGAFAMEWTDTAISIWYFPREFGIPQDIASKNPQPRTWGVPEAMFTGGDCRFNKKLRDLRIIFNITFCGHWAGEVWGLSPCSTITPECEEFVEKFPGAFRESYWGVKSVRIYQQKP